MKILVTGGAGFIGSNFIHYMLKNSSATIVNLDKLTYAGNLENLKGVDESRYVFVEGDICDESVVDKATEGCDVVVNFAAETHVDRSIGEPDAFIKTDVFGAFTLLEAARKHEVKKFIQISTDEVYGSIKEGSFKETDKLSPSSPYSSSKAGGEMLAYSYFVTYGLPVVVTRCSNNYGPRQYPEKLIPLFITNLMEGKKVPLYGDGSNVRDWIYVDDHCSAIHLLIEKGVNGDVYNIGADEEKTNLEITNTLISGVGRDSSSIEQVEDRAGHDFRYSLDSSKLRALGWKPSVVFSEGISKTIAWYRDNSDWWKKIKSGEYKEYYMKHYKERHGMEAL